MTDQDFINLATDLATLPVKERMHHLMDHIRHELDMARSSREWDNVEALSGKLGGHEEPLGAAMLAPEPKRGK